MRRVLLALLVCGCFDFDSLSKDFGDGGGPDGSGTTDGGCVTTQGQVMVPGGPFMMGCVTGDTACGTDENPYHMVNVSGFTIDRVEVTQKEYNMCVASGMCGAPPCGLWNPLQVPDQPVTCVTWIQAKLYCQFVGGRLPTEAEWEKAARSGDGREFPWGNSPPDCSWVNYGPCTQGLGAPTSCMNSSPFGALDMAGNAREWVNDWYSAVYYSQNFPNDPQGPTSGTARVIRGGGVNSLINEIRTSARDSLDPTMNDIDLGFRCANRTR